MLAMDTTLVAEQGECSKTRCGPRGKGSRCGVAWSGLGAYRHGQKIFAERAGHSTSGIPGPGEGVTRDHPEGQRQRGSREPQESGAQLEASAKPITGPAFIICQATPQRPAAGPKGLRPPSHVRTILFPYLSFWASFQAWRKTAARQGEEVSRGRGEEKDCAPFPGPASRRRQVRAKGGEKG